MKTTKVRFKCRNCNHVFTKEYDKNIIVDSEGIIDGAAYTKKNLKEGILEVLKYRRRYVECPNCGVEKCEIKKRIPVGD